jgi:transcriptional regulator with XRE-family HTH domain
MDQAKRKRLEAQGYWVGDAAEFAALEPHERDLLELRSRLRRGIKAARERNGLTQAQVAVRMRSTQARVAKAESGTTREVSLETMVRALYAAGGSLDEVGVESARKATIKRATKVAPSSTVKSKAAAKAIRAIEPGAKVGAAVAKKRGKTSA